MPSLADRLATQEFEIRSVLIGHCGEVLTPNAVDKIAAELVKATREGPCAWAFAPVLNAKEQP